MNDMLIEQFATITIPDGVDIQMPPNCFTEMQGTVLEYAENEPYRLFPVFENIPIRENNAGRPYPGGVR